jgi:hypothetical protein
MYFQARELQFQKGESYLHLVTFDQTKTLAGKKDLSKETRILELIKSEWKIVNRTGFYMPTADKTIKDESLTTSKEKDKKEISGKDKKSSSEKDKKGIGEKVKSESSENEPKTKTRKKSEK